MSERELQEPRVVIHDLGVDVAYARDHEGDAVLYLRPDQSFGSAVHGISAACPHLHPSAVRRMVREHLPGAQELLLEPSFSLPGLAPAAISAAPRPPAGPRRRGWSRPAVFLSFALTLTACLCGLLLAANAAEPTASLAPASPYDSHEFGVFESAAGLTCDQVSTLAARCITGTGEVLASEAAIGNGWQTISLAAGSELVMARLYDDPALASAWAAQRGVQGAYLNLRTVGSVVLWGNSASRVDAIAVAVGTAEQ